MLLPNRWEDHLFYRTSDGDLIRSAKGTAHSNVYFTLASGETLFLEFSAFVHNFRLAVPAFPYAPSSSYLPGYVAAPGHLLKRKSPVAGADLLTFPREKDQLSIHRLKDADDLGVDLLDTIDSQAINPAIVDLVGLIKGQVSEVREAEAKRSVNVVRGTLSEVQHVLQQTVDQGRWRSWPREAQLCVLDESP